MAPRPPGPRFLLFHRRRVWSESELRWIGWERKRGKLHELNRLLRGAKDTTFVDANGGTPALSRKCKICRHAGLRYAPAARRRPAADRQDGASAQSAARRTPARIVVEGYAVFNRVSRRRFPKGGDGSLFQRVFSSSSGIDPYASAVSDVYQDMFGEGSYAGKGIYDIDAFETALRAARPDSTLLSHDLFEGTFARAWLRLGYRGRRGIPFAIRRQRAPTSSVGARRLAVVALDTRLRQARSTGTRRTAPNCRASAVGR